MFPPASLTGSAAPSACQGQTLRGWLDSAGGAAPFRQFMEAALYAPDSGYYSRRVRTVGREGDFSTSATLGTALAGAVAAWVRASGGGPGERRIRDLIELGPGSGRLHRELRRALGWMGRWRWRSRLVERSPALRAEQQRILRGARMAGRAFWHDSPEQALAAAGGRALIFSNELVDAFPVTLLQRHEGVWKEVWLERTAGGGVAETLRPLTGPAATLLKAEDFVEGQRVESHDSWREWVERWKEQWTGGAMLTVDYGASAEELYIRRPQGTVRGYCRHRRLEGLEIYRDPGHCDLTADVNFTDLRHWGGQAGLETIWEGKQAEFIAGWLPARALEKEADRRLADPADAGGAFRCLIQRPLPRPGADPGAVRTEGAVPGAGARREG